MLWKTLRHLCGIVLKITAEAILGVRYAAVKIFGTLLAQNL
jgi:hypothetical protein